MDQNQVNQIVEQLQNQQATIQGLQAQLNTQNQQQANQLTHEHLQLLAQAATQTAPPTLQFPDPGKFDGKSSWTYQQWRQKVSAKLTADGDRLGSPEQRAWYVFAMLDSPASDRAAPWLSNQTNLTSNAFLQYLDSYYLDPTYQEKASQKLYRLRQGKRQSLTSFLTQFDQLLLEAGGASWPDQSKISLLRNAVSPELLVFLVGRMPPKTYEKLKQCLREVDNNYSLRQ